MSILTTSETKSSGLVAVFLTDFSGFHSDLSMNNITELPASVFKNFPYLEEL